MAQQPPPQQPQQPQAPQPRPVPNPANIHAAVNRMTALGGNIAQDVQAYTAEQTTFANEMSLCANYDAAQVLQQMAAMQAAIQANITLSMDLSDAR
jgi:hypothetical protein